MTDVSMQRILLDTNVLLDYLLHRDDHAKMAESVMELGAKNNVTLLCASLSLKDIAYLSSSAILGNSNRMNRKWRISLEAFCRHGCHGIVSSR